MQPKQKYATRMIYTFTITYLVDQDQKEHTMRFRAYEDDDVHKTFKEYYPNYEFVRAEKVGYV